MSPELTSKINIWREKAAAGTLSLDEMKEAIVFLRGDRKASAAAKASDGAKRAKAVKIIPSAASLLDELDGL